MDRGIHDDFFGEDDFDDLPANTLDELEERARVSTQHRQSTALHGTQQQWDRYSHVPGRVNGPGAVHHRPSSDYGFDNEEDVIDLDAQPSFAPDAPPQPRTAHRDEVTEREQWRRQRYGQPSQAVHTHGGVTQRGLQDHEAATLAPNGNDQHGDQDGDAMLLDGAQAQGDGINVSALQARIVELEQHARNMQRSAEDAVSASRSKAGEIAIVRANQRKEVKEFERKMKTIQQTHAEEIARTKGQLEAMRKERERFETSSRFLEHDLAREPERARTIRRTLRDGNANAVCRGQASPLSTPRKHRNLPLRDGFDDGEIGPMSPSKVKDRVKAPSTPKAGAKRKRSPPEDEPAAPSPVLFFSGADHLAQAESSTSTPSRQMLRPMSPPIVERDDRFELMQLILDHRAEHETDRTLEILTKHSFPSRPETSLASIINDKLSQFASNGDVDEFRSHVCFAIADLWAQCLAENFYEPLYNLTELLRYILLISPSSLSTSLIARLTPLCQQGLDLVTLPTIRACIDPVANKLPSLAFRRLANPIDSLNILQVLANQAIPTSVASTTSTSDLINFWSHMGFESTLLVLHKAQPLPQIRSMLRLLHTSILPSSFGPIFPDPTRQKKMEANLIERLSNFLLEVIVKTKPPPRPRHFSDFLRKKSVEEEDEEAERNLAPYDAQELLALRSSVLELLYALALSSYGGALVATHKNMMARLVRFLHESVVKMYTTYDGHENDSDSRTEGFGPGIESSDPDSNVVSSPVRVSLHRLHIAHINTAITLLYHLNMTYGAPSSSPSSSSTHPPKLNLLSYLAAHPSASQRFLVALSRVAFSEPWGAEAGIEEDVAGMAHELLDETVSPEEGEGVLSVFGSGRVSGAG